MKYMSIQEVSAERKFWGTPELIENLPFLDAFSTKNLAESHQLTRRILRNGLNWNKLIKRTFPQKRYYHYSVPEPTNVILEFEREKARLLAEILSMSKDSSQLEMDLLHAICEKFSLANKSFYNTGNFVSVSCSCLQTGYRDSSDRSAVYHLYLDQPPCWRFRRKRSRGAVSPDYAH